MSSRAVSTEHPSPAGWLLLVIAIPTPPVVHPIEAVRPWRSMTSCLHGLPRFARNDNQRAWTAASRFAPRSDETTAYGPYAVLVTRNHGHSPAGAPATHAGWWIGRPGVGPIRRCHRACVSITALMSTSRCASSARRRAWARERIPGPPALPHPVEKGVFLRLQRGPVGSGHFLRPHRGPGVRARFRSPLLVSGKTLVLNRDLTPLPLSAPLALNIHRQQAGSNRDSVARPAET